MGVLESILNILITYDWLGLIIIWGVDKFTNFIPIPEKWEVKITLFLNKIRKRNELLEVKYVFKSSELDTDVELLEKVSEIMIKDNFSYLPPHGDWLKFSTIRGEIEPTITVKPTVEYSEEYERDILINLEFEIYLDNIKFRNIDGDLNDMIRTSEELEHALIETVGKFVSYSMTCKVSKMYRFIGPLSDFNMKGLRGEINNNKVEFKPQEITIYGRCYQNMLRLLKNMIAFYY